MYKIITDGSCDLSTERAQELDVSVVPFYVSDVYKRQFMYRLELLIFAGSKTHQFTGGANLISAILVLAIMILPTLINITETALKAVPDDYRKSSLALGASQMQTIFKVVLPSAKSGIVSAIVLGVGLSLIHI